jgi:hypothetical protein
MLAARTRAFARSKRAPGGVRNERVDDRTVRDGGTNERVDERTACDCLANERVGDRTACDRSVEARAHHGPQSVTAAPA